VLAVHIAIASAAPPFPRSSLFSLLSSLLFLSLVRLLRRLLRLLPGDGLLAISAALLLLVRVGRRVPALALVLLLRRVVRLLARLEQPDGDAHEEAEPVDVHAGQHAQQRAADPDAHAAAPAVPHPVRLRVEHRVGIPVDGGDDVEGEEVPLTNKQVEK